MQERRYCSHCVSAGWGEYHRWEMVLTDERGEYQCWCLDCEARRGYRRTTYAYSIPSALPEWDAAKAAQVQR